MIRGTKPTNVLAMVVGIATALLLASCAERPLESPTGVTTQSENPFSPRVAARIELEKERVGSDYWPYGVPLPRGDTAWLPPEPYDEEKHGPPVRRVEPLPRDDGGVGRHGPSSAFGLPQRSIRPPPRTRRWGTPSVYGRLTLETDHTEQWNFSSPAPSILTSTLLSPWWYSLRSSWGTTTRVWNSSFGICVRQTAA